MRAAEDRHDATLAIEIADRIGGEGRTGEGADEHDVGFIGNQGIQIFAAGVAEISDIMAKLLAPCGDRLRHDARQIGIHDAGEQPLGRTSGDEVKHGYAASGHEDFIPLWGRQDGDRPKAVLRRKPCATWIKKIYAV